MEEKLKTQIDTLLSGECPVEEQADLLLKITSDSEALAYLYRNVAQKDPEVVRSVMENLRMAYNRKLMEDYGDFIPASAYAVDKSSALFDDECEEYLLDQFGKEAYCSFVRRSGNNYWLKNEGTPLFNIGKLLELNGLFVQRIDDGGYEKMLETLETCKVIAVVDGGILLGESESCAYHAVVVESVSVESGKVYFFNPAADVKKSDCPINTFIAAWEKSKCYMLAVRNRREEHEYSPQPIDTSSVELNKELIDLVEFLAENAHDVWAKSKMAKGYEYGPDDATHNHFLKPYHLLTEVEKDQDRDSVQATIKVLKRLGYRLVNINNMHRCPHCGEGIEPNNNFCPSCGEKLTWEDFK